MSCNCCVKFATQIQFCVATKTILSCKLRCEPDYSGHCIHTHVRVCVRTHTHSHTHTHTYTHADTHVQTHMCTHTHTHTRAQIHTRTDIIILKNYRQNILI